MTQKIKSFFVPILLQEELHYLIDKHIRSSNRKKSFLKFCYVLHKLYHELTLNKNYSKEGCRLHSKVIEKLLHDDKTERVLINLQAWKIIKCIDGYIVGAKSKSYKLTEKYEEMKISRIVVTAADAKFVGKLIQEEKAQVTKSTLLKRQYDYLQNSVTINLEGLNYLKEKYPSLADIIDKYPLQDVFHEGMEEIEPRDIVLYMLFQKIIFVKRPDKKNRIFSNLTSLPREHRKYLLIEGKPLISTDLVNSQILFSVPAIEEKYTDITINKRSFAPPLIVYKSFAERGKVYERVAAFCKEDISSSENRKSFKERFFAEVFFCSLTPKADTGIRDGFAKAFPAILAAIKKIKQDEGDYKKFAVRMQELEAEVIIDTVLAELYRRNIVALSLHDSIYVSTPEHLAIAEKLIREAMVTRYNLNVNFKRE